MQPLKPVHIAIIALLAAAAAIAFVVSTNGGQPSPGKRGPMTFEECAAAGNPVMESYPRQCRSADGRLFVEDVSAPTPPPGKESPTGDCAVAGCSGTICTGSKEAADIVTTCEYRAEYACYRLTKCERQATGKCGWTETAAFTACLSSPPPLE
jgi:eight-cysteine-cluster-containing protein